ncbi:uncharacterized protein LOC125031069 [Penaeus chinensis]|uniref:uncharacterized protein LOC125031069 n=1 Tax=Penaeus chinensis TaxID=139456 RepID=UPI001FB7CC98|nr:uncharacterized protein LOC125031069 [Penaeus chinensis]
MDSNIYTIVRAGTSCWDLIEVNAHHAISRNLDSLICDSECLDAMKSVKPRKKFKNEGLHFCVFLKELKNSKTFRSSFINHAMSQNMRKKIQPTRNKNDIPVIILWTINDSIPHIIDKEWCVRMNECAVDRQNLDTVMSWLSTLGGACSALGDYDTQFAKRAGEISVKQMEIALRLGDPFVMSRCRLYLAISMIQQRRFKGASAIVRYEYHNAHTLPKEARDHRLIKMCHGIWTKLRHERRVHRLSTKINSSRTV